MLRDDYSQSTEAQIANRLLLDGIPLNDKQLKYGRYSDTALLASYEASAAQESIGVDYYIAQEVKARGLDVSGI